MSTESQQNGGHKPLPKNQNQGNLRPRNETIMTTSLQDQWEDIILRISKLLVLHPDKLEVYRSSLNDDMIHVKVHTTGDRGKLIGNNGVYSKGIEAILNLSNAKNGTNIIIDYNAEPSLDARESYPNVPGKVDWNSAEVTTLASDLAEQAFDGPFTVDVVDGDPKKPEERFVSVVKVIVSRDENPDNIQTFNRSLAPLFRGIGIGLGRKQLILKAKADDDDPR